AIIVVNASQNDRTVFRLEQPLMNFLGKISYGLYMYHPICIGTGIALATRVTGNAVLQNVIIYTVSIGGTIFVSWLSYNYFENFFLKLKTRFQIVRPRKKVELATVAEETV
ncbi:MAG TPA: hypothetical protein VHK69_16505, partial [Chitinophagaceae bacterium]|nr:hypothetical protein [Chitinophagaceae bacterium]